VSEPIFSLWVYLAATPLAGLMLTLVAYVAGFAVYERARFHPLANPVPMAVALVVAALAVTGTDYRTYFDGAQFVHFLLGPAVVGLAVPLVRDDALQRYVNLVGNWVALQSGRSDITWRFGVLDTEDINAFAAPGGYIFVTKGLYRLLDNEAQLAGVLAHEIAHVTRKHHLKVLKQSSLISMLGQVAGSKAQNSDELVQNLIGNGAEIMARGLDKNAEYEADRVGMVFAARAGYEPWGLPEVLQDMAALPAKDERTSLLYKTHPHPADRIAELGKSVDGRLDAVHGKDLASRFYRIQ